MGGKRIEGWLLAKGKLLWARRFCRLAGSSLEVYENKSEARVGDAPLSVLDVYAFRGHSQRLYGFCIDTP